MKHLSPAYIGGCVIVAVMFLAVFVGGANACHHNADTAEQTSTEVPQKTEKTEVEARSAAEFLIDPYRQGVNPDKHG